MTALTFTTQVRHKEGARAGKEGPVGARAVVVASCCAIVVALYRAVVVASCRAIVVAPLSLSLSRCRCRCRHCHRVRVGSSSDDRGGGVIARLPARDRAGLEYGVRESEEATVLDSCEELVAISVEALGRSKRKREGGEVTELVDGRHLRKEESKVYTVPDGSAGRRRRRRRVVVELRCLRSRLRRVAENLWAQATLGDGQ
jgi:hypothetical protein